MRTEAMLVIGSLVVVLAALLTGLLRRHALRAGMLDVPNDRSSHVSPTPRGGGMSICLCVLGAIPVLAATGNLPGELALSLGCGGLLVTAIGWQEDRRGVPLQWRALGYLGAAAMALYFLGDFGGYRGYAGYALGIVGIAWLTNLYNFMDGTDALAGIETVAAAAFAAVLFFAGGEPGPGWICLVMSAATVGFLYWNWPPAKIFMGDSGSCFIGFTLGVLAADGARGGAVPVLAWCILLAVFICDASFTLLRRMMTGEKWYTAHRSHAYQLLVQAGMTHRRLALYVAAINFLVLGPLAVLALGSDLLLPAAGATFAAGAVVWAVVQRRRLIAPKAPDPSQ